jgi:hypothetical protein
LDTRHFELQDLLSEALIALEAGDHPKVARAIRKALAWVEHDWLATPAEVARPVGPEQAMDAADDEED